MIYSFLTVIVQGVFYKISLLMVSPSNLYDMFINLPANCWMWIDSIGFAIRLGIACKI